MKNLFKSAALAASILVSASLIGCGGSGSSIPAAPQPSPLAGMSIVTDMDEQPETLINGQAGATLAVFKFLGRGKVSSLKFRRTGFSTDSNIRNIRLLDGGVQIGATTQPIDGVFSFQTGNMIISGSKALSIRADLAEDMLAGQSVGVELTAGTFNDRDMTLNFPAMIHPVARMLPVPPSEETETGLHTFRSIKPGDFFTLIPAEVLEDEDVPGTSWTLEVINSPIPLGLSNGSTEMADWSGANPWSYVAPDNLLGRYGLTMRATNNQSGRPVTFRVLIDSLATDRVLPFSVYPIDQVIGCQDYSGRIWLDSKAGQHYSIKKVQLIDPATGTTGSSWIDEDDLGIEIEISRYWLFENDVQMVTLQVQYWVSGGQIQMFTADFTVDQSCRQSLGMDRKATDTPPTWTPTPGVQRQR